MSRRTNFIDGNDNFREQNLRFVRNEFEDNMNQFFGAGNNNGGNGPGPSRNGAPPRDAIIVQPTPGKRNYELDQRRQYIRQLGVNRNQAHILAVASFKVPDFNLNDIQRERYRLNVEAGDNRKAEVDAIILRQITDMVNLGQEERCMERPGTPPPPSDIDWHVNRNASHNFRDVPRQRDASFENFGLVRRFDGKEGKRNDRFLNHNDNFRREGQNFERGANFHEQLPQNFEHGNYRERINDYRKPEQFIDNKPRFMGNNRNQNIQDIAHNDRNEGNTNSYNNNREQNISNFCINRRQASPENDRDNNFHGEQSRSFNRNFSNFDMNNYNENYGGDGNYRRNSPDHRRFADGRNDPRFYNQQNQTYSGDHFREQQSGFGPNSSHFEDSFQNNIRSCDVGFQDMQNVDNFNPRRDFENDLRANPTNNFDDGNENIFNNRNQYNADSNALLNPGNRREFCQELPDRTNRNWNSSNNVQSGYQSVHDNIRNISKPNIDQMHGNYVGQLENRHQQQPRREARNNSINRSNQASVGNRMKQPPNQAGKYNIVNQSKHIDNNTSPHLDGPSTSQAAQQNQQQQKYPPHVRTAQKRVAGSSNSEQLTNAEIKRRKLAEKRGFIIGGLKLPYINRSEKKLPQPEDKSYAVTFFEQEPIYNTSRCAIDNDEGNVADIADQDEENTDDDEAKPSGQLRFKVGVRKRNAIRKSIGKEWTKLYRKNNYKCWLNWWKAYKWCELEMNKKLESFGSLNIQQSFLPAYPKKKNAQVINMVMKAAHFSLVENTQSHYRNAKTLYMLMNKTFLGNLSLPIIEQLQDMIRSTPNHLWVYKMRTMVYLWAEYFKIVKANPRDERSFQAISAKWKSPVFHWMCKQAFDELKAISEFEWDDHKIEYLKL